MTPRVPRFFRSAGQTSSLRLMIIVQVVIILVACAVFIAVVGPGRTIRCERASAEIVDCTVTQALFERIPLDTYTIPNVQAAALDRQCSGDDCAYALEMYGNNGFVLVDQDYVRDLTVRQKIADRINEFLQNPDGTAITFKDQEQPLVYIISAAAFLALLFLLGVTIWQGKRQSM